MTSQGSMLRNEASQEVRRRKKLENDLKMNF
jgi:hypothetical protein